MGKEITWINWVKCFCILFIYINHSEIYCHSYLPYRTVYLTFFVNSFFIVSGYLFFKSYVLSSTDNLQTPPDADKKKHFLGNIVFKLVIPSILFSAVNFFPKKILRGEDIFIGDLMRDTVCGGSMWFTNALAIAEILLFLPLLGNIKKVSYLFIYSSLLALSAYLIYQSNTIFAESPIPMFYKSGMCATLLLSLGGVYLCYEKQANRLFENSRNWLIVLIFSGYTYCCTNFFKFYSGALDVEPLNFVGILLITVSTLLIITACKRLPSVNCINFWGRRTIGLYFFCGALPNLSAIILFHFHIPSAIRVLLCTCISLILALLVVYILNRLVPWVYDLRLMKRK